MLRILSRKLALGALLILALALAACGGGAPAMPPPPQRTIAVNVSAQALARATPCASQFVARRLGVATGVRMREIATYASNGAGLAAGDLDGDDDLDLVFASIDREATILWNDGDLRFSEQALAARFTRAVAIVDVDGDNRLDIVFTHRGIEPPSFWRNQGAGATERFVQQPLAGVDRFAYAIAWADLSGDNRLDLVTGAYDADLRNHGVAESTIQSHGGVTYFEQNNGGFAARQLDTRAETLAIALVDLDGDGRRDIWAGNDFALRDDFWLYRDDAWARAEPFGQTSHSTMSIDWADLDRDGRMELFSTDMNPGNIAPAVLAAWLPVISKLEEKHGPNDPQIMQNVLQRSNGRSWSNEAAWRGVDATGWSWSAKFGDLDNDGWLDLYVVNGMIATNLFHHLPGNELVEENRAFRNRGDGHFVLMPQWNLGSTASGRGMVMADLDSDGDLDIVVNNLRSSAQLFENRLCGGDSLQVDLFWPASGNTRALGAQLELHTSAGILLRDVRSGSGYLSGDAARIHFGIPAGTELHKLVIRYPDGAAAEISDPTPHTLLKVVR